MMRVCSGCGKLTAKRRCPECQRAYEVQRGPRRIKGAYDSEWRKLVAQAIREHPWCSVQGCRSTDLTGDHIVPRKRGGRNVRSNIRVLCRGHNSMKGSRLNEGAPLT